MYSIVLSHLAIEYINHYSSLYTLSHSIFAYLDPNLKESPNVNTLNNNFEYYE